MMIMTPVSDMSLVKGVASDPYIWAMMSSGVSIEEFEPEATPRDMWLVITVEGEDAGLVYVRRYSSCALEFHPYLLKKHRALGREMAKCFFRWVLDCTVSTIIKVNTTTPSKFKSTINTALKCGFKKEGEIRDGYELDGKVYNVIQMGITREEMCHELEK